MPLLRLFPNGPSSLCDAAPSFTRLAGRVLAAATLTVAASVPSAASAQWFGFGRNRCEPCEAAAPVYQAAYAPAACGSCQTVAAAPVIQQTACAVPVQQTACVAVQPVQQTVYQEVPVTKYRKVAKTERRPVYKTAYEEREVTVMQQQYEQRTAEVPFTTYQSVTDFRPQTIDRSHWQTVYRPNQKISSCRVDCRPGFAGWWGRTRNDIRNAFTPDRVATRQFVPDVRQAMVPVTRQVPITATRTVTYNVAKMVPVKTMQRVAVLKQEYEDVPVTAYEPYTTTETVAVGTRTQLAYIGANGQPMTAGITPTRARTATADDATKTANGAASKQDGDDPFGTKLNSIDPLRSPQSNDRLFDGLRPEGFEPPTPASMNLSQLTAKRTARRTLDPRALAGFRVRRSGENRVAGWVRQDTPTVLQVAGWQPVKSKSDGPELDMAMNVR